MCSGYETILTTGATGAFNVGRDDDYRTMKQIALHACDIAHVSPELIQEVDPPQRKTMIKRLSTEKLRRLGWEPTVSLEVGMPIVYEWVKNYKWHE